MEITQMKNVLRFLFTIFFLCDIAFAQDMLQKDSLKANPLKVEPHPRDQYRFGEGYAEYPLKPPATSSPRATLFSFLDNMNRAYAAVKEAHRENLNSAGLFNSSSAVSKAEQAEILFMRAVECLDLSQLPQALKTDLSYEKALMLKEILDKTELPYFTEVPDEEDIEQEAELEKVLELDSWRMPNADIVIARIEDGPRKGEYLFTARTIDRLDNYYQLVKDLPYDKKNEVSEGFYSFYIRSPGKLLPPKWISFVPDSLSERTYYSQTIWQWLGLFLTFVIVGLVIRFLFIRLIKAISNSSNQFALFRKGIFLLACALLIIFIDIIDDAFLNITGIFLIWTRLILSFTMWLLLAGSVYFFINAISESLINSEKVSLKGIQRAYTKIISLLFSLIVAVFIFILGLSRLGISLIPLVTGAGIGGIAIALAARSTLENVIASFTIFTNKPFRLGHEIEMEGFRGTVVDIGLSKTTIRQLDGKIAIIPNKNIINATVENIQERPYWRKEMDIVISYADNPEMVQMAVDILKNVLSVKDVTNKVKAKHPNHIINRPDHPPRVFFQNIKQDNQVIKIFYWYADSDKWAFHEHEDYINFRIVESFKDAGIEFAIPTQIFKMGPEAKEIQKDDSKKNY